MGLVPKEARVMIAFTAVLAVPEYNLIDQPPTHFSSAAYELVHQDHLISTDVSVRVRSCYSERDRMAGEFICNIAMLRTKRVRFTTKRCETCNEHVLATYYNFALSLFCSHLILTSEAGFWF